MKHCTWIIQNGRSFAYYRVRILYYYMVITTGTMIKSYTISNRFQLRCVRDDDDDDKGKVVRARAPRYNIVLL